MQPSCPPQQILAMNAAGEKSVISMSLFGSNIRYVLGALENARLVKDTFPGE